jgi:hypothetical protein
MPTVSLLESQYLFRHSQCSAPLSPLPPSSIGHCTKSSIFNLILLSLFQLSTLRQHHQAAKYVNTFDLTLGAHPHSEPLVLVRLQTPRPSLFMGSSSYWVVCVTLAFNIQSIIKHLTRCQVLSSPVVLSAYFFHTFRKPMSPITVLNLYRSCPGQMEFAGNTANPSRIMVAVFWI